MSLFRIKRVLKVPQPIMLNVVGDVAKYKEFVPYCTNSTVTEYIDNIPSKAELSVGWQAISDTFESHLTYKPDTVIATAGNKAKMFEKLACTWTIKKVSEDKCHAALDLEFKFASSLYNAVSGKVGPLVAKQMIEAFSKRAFEEAARTSEGAGAKL